MAWLQVQAGRGRSERDSDLVHKDIQSSRLNCHSAGCRLPPQHCQVRGRLLLFWSGVQPDTVDPVLCHYRGDNIRMAVH